MTDPLEIARRESSVLRISVRTAAIRAVNTRVNTTMIAPVRSAVRVAE